MAITEVTGSYSDIKGTTLSNSSMLRMFDILKDEDGNYFMNIFKTYQIEPTILQDAVNIDKIVVIEPWWDSIAYSYYNDVDIWWLACLANYVIDPCQEILPDKTITMLIPAFIPFVQNDMGGIFDL